MAPRRRRGTRVPDRHRAPAGCRRGLRPSSTSTSTDVLAGTPRLLAVCADVRDPGNAGTVIRCADAAGARGVVLTGTVGRPLQRQEPCARRPARCSTSRSWSAADDPTPSYVGCQAAGLTVLAADGAGETDLDDAEDAGLLDRPDGLAVRQRGQGSARGPRGAGRPPGRDPDPRPCREPQPGDGGRRVPLRLRSRATSSLGQGLACPLMSTVGSADQQVLDVLPDGVVVADEAGTVVLMNAGGHSPPPGPPTVSASTWPTSSRCRTRPATTGTRAPSPTTGSTPARASRSRRGSSPTAPSCWSPPGSCRPSAQVPVGRVAVSLRSARARARLDRERSDLVATVAHELRSPLTGVKGFTATLLAKWDGSTTTRRR